MYKLVSVDDKEFEEKMKRKIDHPNQPPKGWESITEQEMTENIFMMYAPDFIEYRQITIGAESFPVWLYYYFDGTGIGIRTDYWNKKMKFWRFGCRHIYRELTQKECARRKIFHGGNCYHVEECEVCKFINVYDSGD